MEEKILKFFKENPDVHLSGEQVSASLNISRSAFWKHIEKLRSLGYEFDAVPHLGYQLRKIPDRLYPQEILFNLKTERVGKDIIYYDTIGSTNIAAHSLAKAGAEEGTVVLAESQDKGKGRLSRQWISPSRKGIYMSVLLRPKMTPFQAPKITLMAAVSAAQAIREIAGIPVSIKWPNDLFIDKKKIGGILTEMEAEPDYIKFLILGIGINVSTKVSDLPKGAGAIHEFSGRRISRIELTKAILERLESNYTIFKKDGFSPIRREWRNLSVTLGRRVRAICMHKKIEGEAVDIDMDGALKIRLDNGFYERVMAGDIVLLR
ncbi:MAG: biotin--[acetyl-CoA-carboxylase] ligase [Candidatus Omnitrophota bacterium]